METTEYEITKLVPPVAIPGIMQILRDIRDQNSLRHMNMTAREILEEEQRSKEKYSFWPKGTQFANGIECFAR
ncbi:MAG: hypothetical protein LBS63_05865 [Prevotellaceae bacterium]|jgi:hypothetical protein|nr:hypothetical protein [Prevotellaceae bacterium]